MKAQTMYDTLASLLGVPVRAIPLSLCRITRPYLLERVGIGANGTVLPFVIPYLMHADIAASERNLSLYAVPRDYHKYVEELGETLLPVLREKFPDHRFALFADHSPIAEVHTAARAGLGLQGENGLLLTPDYGSFVFIAEIVTDADYATVTGQSAPCFPALPPPCEGCGACRAACPAREGGLCLSALTQKKGLLPDAELSALRAHDLVWGCDACQMVCPHNRGVLTGGRDTPIAYFHTDRMIRVTAESVQAMDEAAFACRAYAWRGKSVILRNIKLKEETT